MLKALSDVDVFLCDSGCEPTAHYKEIIQAVDCRSGSHHIPRAHGKYGGRFG